MYVVVRIVFFFDFRKCLKKFVMELLSRGKNMISRYIILSVIRNLKLDNDRVVSDWVIDFLMFGECLIEEMSN